MDALVPCPSCHRHARVSRAVCPFCGESVEGLAPPAVRRVSRRELTRAAVFGGAALLLGVGCQRDAPPERRTEGDGSGGERLADGEPEDFSTDRDTGRGRDTHVRDEDRLARERRDAERRELSAEQRAREAQLAEEQLAEERRAAELEAARLREEQRRFEEEQRRDHYRRTVDDCNDPGCMAMPYGAPPSRERWV